MVFADQPAINQGTDKEQLILCDEGSPYRSSQLFTLKLP